MNNRPQEHHHTPITSSQNPLPPTIQRMGILVQHPPGSTSLRTSVNWAQSVVGVFFDVSPPSSNLVSNIINNRWETRDLIRIYRTGTFFIFECQNPVDRDSLLLLNTTMIDGKPITFRPCSEYQIPASINFNMARLWVHLHDLPWDFLENEWTIRILTFKPYWIC